MNEDLKPLLEENIRLASDNNRMLRAIRRDAWFGFAGKIILWLAVLVLPFYFYATYLGRLVESTSSLSPDTQNAGEKTGSFFGLPFSPSELQKLIE